MMIECPRCGFAQPKDQYCASCGVNMDALLAKPKPFLVRLLANPNFHLSLIAGLIVLVVGWIFYTQSAMVSREVGRILDLPVASRNAGDPAEQRAAEEQAAKDSQAVHDEADESDADAAELPVNATATSGPNDGRTPEEILADAVGAPRPTAAGAKGAVGVGASASGTADPQKIELSFWEIRRESLANIVPTSQRLPEGTAGRAYFWPQGAKIFETVQANGQALGTAKSVNLAANAQVSQSTAATAPEMFQFSVAVQVAKFENKEASLNWLVNFVLPQPEPPGQTAPAMRQVMEGSLNGQATLNGQGLIMLLMDPPNRAPKEEYMAKAGDGSWSIFKSPEFRSGLTDWVMVIQLK